MALRTTGASSAYFLEHAQVRIELAFMDAPATVVIQRFDANTGYAAALTPDLDGDGYQELLLGAPDDPQAGRDAGAIAVLPVPR